MGDEDKRRFWDQKFEQGLPSLTKPDPFFTSAYAKFARPAFPKAGVALDLAGGLGRHALWLAKRGWRVRVVDISEVALGKLGRASARLSLDVQLVVRDAADFEFGLGRYDLILLFYHPDRGLLPKIAPALRPDGLAICKLGISWGRAAADGAADRPLARNELPTLLTGLKVLHHSERPLRDRGVVERVGRKH